MVQSGVKYMGFCLVKSEVIIQINEETNKEDVPCDPNDKGHTVKALHMP